MMTPAPIVAAQVLASGLAVALAVRSRAHLPVALLVPFGLACDLALEVCGPAPEGWRFGAGVVAGSVYPWAVWAAARVALKDTAPRRSTFQGRASRGEEIDGASRFPDPPLSPPYPEGVPVPKPTPARAIAQALAAWLILLADIFATGIRGAALARTYAAAQAIVAGALVVTVWRWRRTREPIPGYGFHPQPLARPGAVDLQSAIRRPSTATEACAVICAAAEVANAGGAYLSLPSWVGGRSAYCLMYVVLVLVQAHDLGGAACRRPTSSTPLGPAS